MPASYVWMPSSLYHCESVPWTIWNEMVSIGIDRSPARRQTTHTHTHAYTHTHIHFLLFLLCSRVAVRHGHWNSGMFSLRSAEAGWHGSLPSPELGAGAGMFF